MAGFTKEHYVNQFLRLLPSGPLWPTQDITTTNWNDYIRAIVCEFQRVDSKINEWLTDYFPGDNVDQLEDWERILSLPETTAECGIDLENDLSLAQRQALVLATIRLAPVTPAELEAMATDLGYTATITQPGNGVRYSGLLSGQRYGGAAWAHSYLYEYMPSLSTAPNDFTDASWTKTNATITADDARAPDGTLTADKVAPAAGTPTVELVGIAATAGDVLQVSAWFKNATDSDEVPVRFFLDQNGGSPTTQSSPLVNLPENQGWYRVAHRFTLDAATTYDIKAFFGTASDDAHMWGFYVGVVDPVLELHLKRATPTHATELPRVVGDSQSWPLTYP